jgi:hypothetical protein
VFGFHADSNKQIGTNTAVRRRAIRRNPSKHQIPQYFKQVPSLGTFRAISAISGALSLDTGGDSGKERSSAGPLARQDAPIRPWSVA